MSLNTIDSSELGFAPKFEIRVVDKQYYEVTLAEDIDFEIEDLKKLVSEEEKIGGIKLPVLVICSPTSSTNVELMKHLSKNKNNPFSTADAFVISSMSQSILANFYSKINKPERPTKFFTKKESALTWLKQFVDSN